MFPRGYEVATDVAEFSIVVRRQTQVLIFLEPPRTLLVSLPFLVHLLKKRRQPTTGQPASNCPIMRGQDERRSAGSRRALIATLHLNFAPYQTTFAPPISL